MNLQSSLRFQQRVRLLKKKPEYFMRFLDLSFFFSYSVSVQMNEKMGFLFFVLGYGRFEIGEAGIWELQTNQIEEKRD